MSVQNKPPGSPGENSYTAQGSSRPDASDSVGKAGEAASEIANQAKDAGRDVAENRFAEGRNKAVGEIDAVGSAVDDLASSLEEQGSPFASYAGELSGQLTSLSEKLSGSSLDDLAASTRSLARNNPAVFLLGSVAIGLAASRFFKATGQEVRTDQTGGRSSENYVESGTRGSGRSTGAVTSGSVSGGTTTTSAGTSGPALSRERVSGASQASISTTGGEA